MPTSTLTPPAAQLMTGAQLLALGTEFHGELVRGKLIETAPASWGQGGRSSKADRLIGDFVERNRLGETFGAETGFYLSRNPDTVRAPDVAFVRVERIPEDADGSGFFDGPPDLAVEILSPNDRTADLLEKVADFLRAGTLEVWVIDPRARTVTVYVSDDPPRVIRGTEPMSDSRALPGFAEPAASFFA